MTQYVALLRGVGPGNPSMRNEKLREVGRQLGLHNVSTVISSGNVIFESDHTDVGSLQGTLEQAWLTRLGFESATIVRSRAQLEALAESDPFQGRQHTKETYLLTTFAKTKLDYAFDFPVQPEGRTSNWWEAPGASCSA